MKIHHPLLTGLLLCIGCAHRPAALSGDYTLEGRSGYSLLVPSLPVQTGESDFQKTVIALRGRKQKAQAGPNQGCSIRGDVFSLMPDSADLSHRWIVKSLSAQGWASHGANRNVHAEWKRFAEQLSSLERRSCFPREATFFTIRRAIAESIPLPASEVAFFLYSFGGTGFVNLAPGMEVKLERPMTGDGVSSTSTMHKGSLEAAYKVTSTSGSDVELRLFRTANRNGAKSMGVVGTSLFELPARFHSKPMLRLFLQSAGDGSGSLPAILVGANSMKSLEDATDEVEKNGRAKCPETLPDRVECMSFGGTAVSLMSLIDVNGKAELLPFGTSMGYMIDVSSRSNSGRALETVSLSRPLVGGGYAEVKFPKTPDAVQQIVLLPGDRMDWKK